MIYLTLFGGMMIGCCLGVCIMAVVCNGVAEDLAIKKAAALINAQVLLGNITFSNKWEKESKPTKKEFVN